MGAGTAAICCLICCICIFASFLIAYIVWALITIFSSGAVASTACGSAYPIWLFCLLVVIVMPILGCCVSVLMHLAGAQALIWIPQILNLFFFVWGCFIWEYMSTECMMFFDSSYWDLILLFKINVVFLGVMYLFLCCIVCFGGVALLSGGGLPIPGKSEEEEDEKDRSLRNACMTGHLDEVKKLLADGARHQSRDRSTGNQALHFAAMAGRTEVCKVLVEAGADLDQSNITGQTPLALAEGHTDTLSYLQSLGARASEPAATQEYV